MNHGEKQSSSSPLSVLFVRPGYISSSLSLNVAFKFEFSVHIILFNTFQNSWKCIEMYCGGGGGERVRFWDFLRLLKNFLDGWSFYFVAQSSILWNLLKFVDFKKFLQDFSDTSASLRSALDFFEVPLWMSRKRSSFVFQHFRTSTTSGDVSWLQPVSAFIQQEIKIVWNLFVIIFPSL